MSGFASYAKTIGDTHQLRLKITGAHCAGCIQKIESTLKNDPNIRSCRLNFTTGSLVVEWTGDVSQADDYVTLISDLGYGVYPWQDNASVANEQGKFLLMCMGVAGFAAGNIMLLSFGLWITNQQTMGVATREFLHLVSALIAIPAIIFSGRPFFKSAWTALKHKRTNMDVPISLALLLATGMSVHELARNAEHVYFDSALMLCFFLLIGRYLDFRARSSARSAATDLMSTLSGFANVIDDKGQMKKIPIRDVQPDMMVQVSVGEKIPVDGLVEQGESTVDTSLVTGETLPIDVAKGSEVHAGTLNISSIITIRTTKASGDSLLSDIVRLMEKAEQGQAAYTRLADRAAKLYTPMVHILALVAFVLWFGFLGASWQDSLLIAVTVLIITCPCALGLAVPVAQVLATGRLMGQKVMVKSGDAMERLAKITSIIFDKTGTLTYGRAELIGDYNTDSLAIAASLAAHSRHPLSVSLAKAYSGDLLEITDIQETAGQGLTGLYKGLSIKLGSYKHVGIGQPNNNLIMLYFQMGDNAPVAFQFKDKLRFDAKDVLKSLSSRNLSLSLLSGDRQAVVKDIASDLPFDKVYGELTPTEKHEYLETMKQNHEKILMVGDGLNDAPVLAGADVSMAPGTAIDMAQNAADIVFMGDGLASVQVAYDMACKTQKIIKQNFMIAIVYNMIAIPIAFMGLVTPMIAAIAMSGSSIFVIFNSFRLKL